jgi:hypothetical protein
VKSGRTYGIGFQFPAADWRQVLGISFLNLMVPFHAHGQCSGEWADAPPLAGINGAVLAAATFDADGPGPHPSRLFAGGEFSIAGGQYCSNLAQFDPETRAWQTFTSGVTGGQVLALNFDQQGHCFVGGAFTSAGGTSISYIALWNGASFESLGSGLNGAVNALARLPDGRLIAAGDFTASGTSPMLHIAQWDGTHWSALRDGLTFADSLTPASVKTLCILSSGELIAAGNFDTAGGQSARRVARWDGSAWHPLGTGIRGGPNTIVSCSQALPDGDFVIGGTFTDAGGIRALNLAKYSTATSEWSTYGLGPGNTVSSLMATPGGALYVGCLVIDAQGKAHRGMVRSPEGSWTFLPKGFDVPIRCFATLVVPPGEQLIVGGDPTNTLHECNATIAACDVSDGLMSEHWATLGDGLASGVESIVQGAGGDYICSGAFFSDGTAQSCYGIANYHPQARSWSMLGVGADGPIRAAARIPNSAYFVAGGSFASIGGNPARNVALWDGSAWRPLGNGVPGDVLALAAVRRGDGFEIYAGGQLDAPFNNIAMYRSSTDTWTTMGAGFDGIVRTLVTNPSRGLIAGGDFGFSAGQRFGGVAEWISPSSRWTPFDSGLLGQVYTLAWAADDTLVAGGSFAADGRGARMANIAMFRGGHWVGLGSGADSVVRAIAVGFGPGIDIIAGGDFRSCGGTPAEYVAHWYGDQWHPFVSAVDAPVRALATVAPGRVVIGGDFASIGQRPFGGFAQWEAAPSSLAIVSQSAGGLACDGAEVSLTVNATGEAPMAYQWTFNGARLLVSDEGAYSGETSATLNLTPVAAGIYRCIVFNTCGVQLSEAIRIEVVLKPQCVSDFNSDGGIDGADLEAFFRAWESGGCEADVNQDGGTDGGDLESFFVRWSAGEC